MKLNWGHYIIIAYVLFAAMLTYFMVKGANNQADLVASDYYNQEVKYQERIDDIQRAEVLGQVELVRAENKLCVKFPDGLTASANGQLHFYKPDNAKLDFHQKLNLDQTNAHCIDAGEVKLTPGLWTVKASITQNGQSYFWEETIFW